MSDNAQLILWLIPGAPLFAAGLIALFGKLFLVERSHVPCVAALAVAFVCSLALLVSIVPGTFEAGLSAEGHAAHESDPLFSPMDEHLVSPQKGAIATGYEWIDIGTMQVRIDLRADAISAIMLVMVTGVSLLVAIFASGYMHGDPGYARFFAAVSLFVFSMCMLVLSGNFVQLFMSWEAVGLCSYLLIGFWFKKPSAAAAAKKAFVINRIGDFGLITGVFLIWKTFGSVDFQTVLFDAAKLKAIYAAHPGTLQCICLLLFIGAMGKSAQFPLHVWLPDAMEGPTPVSALIHAATMVTAGVYLVARSTPLFMYAPNVQLFVTAIGATTALIALTQYDLKRVMAYSTTSQLGFMFMALGASAAGPRFATFAVMAAMFHLFTHAYFKALLFLASGSVMHSMGDVIDMRRFSGLRHALPVTHWTFLCGALALAGFPLMAGFWSKDDILAALANGMHSEHKLFFTVIFAVAVLTALLTAFYTFRAYFMTFWGPEKFPEEALSGHGHGGPDTGHDHEHGHDSSHDHGHDQAARPHDAPPAMAWPLRILAVCAVGIGFVGPLHLFGTYFEATPGLPPAAEHHMHFGLMALSAIIAISGIAIAYKWYVLSPEIPARLATGLRPLFVLSHGKLYFDELFTAILVAPLRLIATLCALFDKYILDGVVDSFGALPTFLSQAPRRLHGGLTPAYAATMLIAVLGCVICVMQLFAAQ
jgi:NADH-quinone oxidoreductase subunit L